MIKHLRMNAVVYAALFIALGSFDSWIEDTEPSDVALPDMDYHFGYRVAP